MSIARQQEIKATLYIMLLQKREENAITLAATMAVTDAISKNPCLPASFLPRQKSI